MSAAIRTDALSASANARAAADLAAASGRRNVETRRVSLQLGPLGVTYATDEVLGGSADSSSSLSSSAAAGDSAEGASAAAWSDAGSSDSGEDMSSARRVEAAIVRAAAAAASTWTYRPVRGAYSAAAAGGGTSAATASSGTASDGTDAAGTQASSQTGGSSRSTAGPFSAQRRACAAYLACAAGTPAATFEAVA